MTNGLNISKMMIIHKVEVIKMKEVCIRAPEYLGCYELPYEIGSGGEEIRFEGGLLKSSGPISKEFQKRIYRPEA